MILICTLLAVSDGDTIRAACPQETRIRIANIDAPERDECPRPAARAADALASLAQGPLTVRPLYSDRYGRIVATVEAQGRDVAGASDAEIMAVTGQSAAVVAYYRSQANKRHLSRVAQRRREVE